MTSPTSGAQGGTPEGQSAEPGNETGTGVQPGTDQGTGAQSGAGAQDGTQRQGQQQDSTGTGSQEEYDRLKARLQAADQNRAKTEAELRQLRDKDIPEIQKLQRDLQEITTRADQAEQALKQTRLENAFYTDNKYQWKNPKTALKLADLSKVEIEEDGRVTGLTAALDALAKSDPYLLQEADSGNDDKDKGKGSTGALGTGGQNSPPTAKSQMAVRFPALRSRGMG